MYHTKVQMVQTFVWGQIDDLNSCLCGIAKEASKSNESGLTYVVGDTESDSEEVGGVLMKGLKVW